MQKGSIVTLQEGKNFDPRSISYAEKHGLYVPKHGELFVLKCDPFLRIWPMGTGLALKFEELPGADYLAELFVEVQPPTEVEIQSLIEQPELV